MGKQAKLDRNKNGKLDKEDFKMLRSGKKRKDEQFIDRVINILVERRLNINEGDYVGQGPIKKDPKPGTPEYLKQTGEMVKRAATPQGRRISRRLKGAARRAKQGQKPHQQPPREGS